MRVYIVRHGAAKTAQEDPSRPLNERGLKEASIIADYLLKRGVKPSTVLHSGKLRARQTAEIIGEKLGVRVEEAEGLNPGDEPWIWAGKLAQMEEDVMLVGHLPHLERLISLLLTDDPDIPVVKLGTGGLAVLEKDELGVWRLLLLVSPKDVEL